MSKDRQCNGQNEQIDKTIIYKALRIHTYQILSNKEPTKSLRSTCIIIGQIETRFAACQNKVKLFCTEPYKHHFCKKSLKIPKGQSESVYRRTDNTIAKRRSIKGQTTIKKTYI